MDSEALLADHQPTDGIVEEKNTVKEKRLNGEESKDEENAAIAEAERLDADRVVLQEAVIYCSKMPNSTSEKECRKEEAIKEVDSFSEVVETTNKTIEMIKDHKNGELEVPLEIAEVAAANGEVESPPVESNNANSAAGDAEGISEQVVVIPTESSSTASATSDVAIAVETREIEAKLEDLTDSVSVKITDDIEVVADEVEKQVSITLAADSSSTEIAEESREVEAEAEAEQQVSSDSRIANSDVEKQVLNESSNAASATSFAEEAKEAETKIEEEKKEAIEVEELEEDVTAEKTGEEVETETKEVTLSVLTTEEIRNTEDKSVDDQKEAAIEVQEQAPSDSSTSTLSNGKRLESKLIDDEQEVPADAEQKIQSNESAGVEEAKIDDGKTEVEQQFPSDSTNADDNQEVPIEAEKHVATEASDVTSIVVTSDEVGSTEARIMEDEKEAEIEVQEQVPSGSSTSTPTDRISEETQKVEPKFVDEEEVVRAEDEKQIPEFTEIGAKVEVEQQFPSDSGGTTSATGITEKSREIEDELADDCKEVITEAEKQVTSGNSNATLAFATAAEVGETEAKIEDDEKEAATEVQEQVQIDSDTFTSANRIAQETKRLESKLIDDDQEVQEEAKKQISSEESSDVRVKIDDGKTEVEPGVEQQFPSDSLSPTSVIVVAERSGEIEAEFADDNKEVKTEVEKQVATETNDVASAVVTADEVRNTETKIDDDEKGDLTEAQEQVPSVSSTSTSADRIAEETKRLESELIDEDKAVLNDSTSAISTPDEFIETKAKIESDEEGAVIEVGEQVSSNSRTSANRTDEVKLADDNQEVVVNAEEQVLIESSRDIFVVAGVEENKEIDAKFKDNKQEEEAAEVRKQELNLQGNEADAANGNERVLAKEETENAAIDGNSDNSNVTEPNTINLVQEDAGTDHTSVVQTAVEISQPEVEVETNKIDSGSFSELPTREEEPNASAEGVDKKDNILEDKAFMDNLNDVNTISQVPRSNDQSQTDAKDINIEISQEDKITLVESSKNLDCSTETNDEFEGKESSEGIEIAEGEKEDILKVGKVILDEDSKHSHAPDITESSNKIEKFEVAKEKCEDSENNSTITNEDETTKSAGENADASGNLSVENKTYEDKEEKQSKDESVNKDYVEAPKDIDVKEEIATAVSAFVDADNKKESEKTIDESLSPKSADLVKLEEEVPKESAPAKSSPRRSNNIISKVKHQIVKAKKAIMGKSPSSKAMSPKSKEEIK
ncbi:serine-rich adhesin for platelets-like [Zingiber officinale]|uniref:serine-rich adhesin for platelets-like n=1 Tax=Zingiber officinale TaxID=94328 RepID=UPI001C4C1B7B|nr:serine-rich adhesin for platelets-like [Zingiber officinale]